LEKKKREKEGGVDVDVVVLMAEGLEGEAFKARME